MMEVSLLVYNLFYRNFIREYPIMLYPPPMTLCPQGNSNTNINTNENDYYYYLY